MPHRRPSRSRSRSCSRPSRSPSHSHSHSRSRSPSRRHKNGKEVPQKRAHDSRSDSIQDDSPDRSTKRPKKDEDIDLIVEYRLAGRGLTRIISAFGNIKQICKFAAARANAEAAGTLDAFAKSYRRLDAKTQKSYLQLYEEILDFLPGFRKIVEGGGKNAALVQKLIKAASKGMECAKNDDRNDFKTDMGDYLPIDATTGAPIPWSKLTKGERGFNSIQYARLLCSVRYLADFDANPELTRQKYLQGQLVSQPKHWPTFVYAGNKYNKNDVEDGLFRSDLLIRMMRYVWTGHTSAIGRDKATGGRQTNSDIHGVKCVTGRMIAYIFIQVRFALTSKERWHPEDGAYKYEEAYDKVVALFEDHPNDPWVLDTLAWYTKQVFSNTGGRPVLDDCEEDSEHDDDDAFDMQARRAAAAAATAAGDAAATAAVETASIDAAAAAAEAAYDDEDDDDDDEDPQARRTAIAVTAAVPAQAATTVTTYGQPRPHPKSKRRIIEYADSSDEEDHRSRGPVRPRDRDHESGGAASRSSAPSLPTSPLTQPPTSPPAAPASFRSSGKTRMMQSQMERAPLPMAAEEPGPSKKAGARRKKYTPAQVLPRQVMTRQSTARQRAAP